jgi:antitoxin ParD1/3/4
MQIVLTPEQEKIVKARLETGAYGSEQEVFDEALRLLVEEEIIESVGIEAVRAEVQQALEQLERGEGIVLRSDEELRAFFEDINARGRQRLEQRRKAQKR